MLLRRLPRPVVASAVCLTLSLPTVAHEHFLPCFVSEAPVPIAYHPRYENLFQGYEQWVRLSFQPSRWRTLAYIEDCGLRKIAARLHLHPAPESATSPCSSGGSNEIPRDSWVYPALKSLQQEHLVEISGSSCYFRNKLPPLFTRYEVAVALQRALSHFTRTRSDDAGVVWESCVVNRDLRRQTARDLIDLCYQFRGELQAIGMDAQHTERLTHTLEAYLRSRPTSAQ